MTDPGDPDLNNGKWVEVKAVTGNSATSAAVDLSQTKPLAQHVAIWMEYDSSTSYFETFTIGEIEVYDVAKTNTNTPLPGGANSCSALGN